MRESVAYQKNGNIRCLLCPRRCVIASGKVGFCGARKNINGTLFSINYSKACSFAVDPIEKKPLFHFAPGSKVLSIATTGCNLSCMFCQNWEISQSQQAEERDLPPEKILDHLACHGLAWTYTEPTIFYEYFLDTAMLARERKMNVFNVWVSNGYTNTDHIKMDLIDAINIDYKGSSDFYKKMCAGDLEKVRESLLAYKKAGVWIEVTNLLINGYNSDNETISDMCNWILENLGKDTPLHFSRYFPMYKLNVSPTKIKTLENAVKIAENSGIRYVYIGNHSHEKENTFCHNCGNVVIKRSGNDIVSFKIEKGHCPYCSQKIPLAGMEWSPFGLSTAFKNV